MDTITFLIVTQVITFLLLLFSEILPFTSAPYNGILQVAIGVLEKLPPLLQKQKEEMDKEAEQPRIVELSE